MATSFANFQPQPVTPIFQSLKLVERDYGVAPFTQLGQILRGAILRRTIAPLEYYKFSMFAPGNESAEARDRFVGTSRNRRINRAFNAMGRARGFVDDKLYYEMILQRNGVPTSETIALFHRSITLGHMTCFADEEGFAAYLRRPEEYPLFGKPLGGSLSLGTISIKRYDAERDAVSLSDGQVVPVPQLVSEIVAEYGRAGYILQRKVEPHPELARFTGSSVGTVRVLMAGDGHTHWPQYACWKIPRPGSPADNFWRDGHLLALLDTETGAVVRVQQGTGARAETVTRREGGPSFEGLRIPDWDRVIDLATRAVQVTGDMRIVGFDVAVSDRGPVIIEANTNPDHALYQIVARRGVMDDRLTAAWQKALADGKAHKAESKAAMRKQRRGYRRRQMEAFAKGTDFRSVLGDRRLVGKTQE